METSDILLRIDECKALIRRVRTPAGARRFGQPIGSIIVRDVIPTSRKKRRKRVRTDRGRLDVSAAQNRPERRSVAVSDAATPPPSTERRGMVAISDLNEIRMDKVLNEEYVEELAAQIRERGVGDNHVMVQETRSTPYVLDGHHFLAAAERAGLSEVPTRTFDSTDAGILEGTRALNRIERAKEETGNTRVSATPYTDAAMVAPAPELPDMPLVERPSNLIDGNTFKTRRAIRRYEGEAPLAAQIDWDYLNNATAKQALIDLDEMGVQLKMSPQFRRDRDFMVSLAETMRIHEEMFPGFIYRHGNIYAGDRGMGAPSGALAYNRIIERTDTDDNAIDDLLPDDHGYSTMSGHRLSGAGGTNADNVTSGYYETTSTDMNQTITVFMGGMLRGGSMASPHTDDRELAWSAAGDWGRKAATESNPRIANMMYVMTHEFGHAINHTVTGNLSFEIDGWSDPDQYKRRWYAEYANNAMLDIFEELGVTKRTGKRYVADALKEQAENFAKIRKAQRDVMEYEEYLEELREYLDGDPYTPEAGAIVAEGFELPEMVKSYMSTSPNVHPRSVISPLELSVLLKGEIPKASPGMGADIFGRAFKAFSPEATFAAWEVEGYIEGFDEAKWRKLVSDYGATKIVEFEAETWASYMLSGNPTKAAFLWGNMVHDMYTWWVQDDMDSNFGKNNPEEG